MPKFDFKPYRIVPPNHAVRIVAKIDAGTIAVEAEMVGVLAGIVRTARTS